MNTYLRVTAFGWLVAWQVLGLGAMIWPTLWLFYFAAAAILLAALYFDYFTIPAADDVELQLVSDRHLELGQTVEVVWHVAIRGKIRSAVSQWNLKLPLIDSLLFHPTMVDVSVDIDADNRQWVAFKTKVKAEQLTRQHDTNLELRVCSGLRLWGGTLKVSGQDCLPQVLPMRQKTPEQVFERAMRNNRSLFTGARVRVRHGAPDQFHSHRPYRHGDPLRFVDHKKSARFGELFTKTFDTLVDQTLIIGCDIGRSMSGRIDGSDKLSFYREAMFNVIENALASHDRVGFFAFAGEPTMIIPPTRNVKAFDPLIKGHAGLRVRPEESDYSLVPRLLQQLAGQRCVFLMFSDLSRPSVQSSLLPQIRAVSHHHLAMLMSLVDADYDIDEQILAMPPKYDAETHAQMTYGYWLRQQFDLFNMQVARVGAGVVAVPERYWLDMTMRIYQTLRVSVLAG